MIAPISTRTAELLEARDLIERAIRLSRVVDALEHELRGRSMAGFDFRPPPSRRRKETTR